jgi:hypothetical protein
MKGAFILAAGLAAQLALTGQTPLQPSPQASPPKQIIDVKSRSLCTALRDNVAISLAGLISNDANIDIGRKAMTKMAADQIKGSKAGQMDALVGENVVGSIVHNLVLIDQKLNDPARFPADPKTDDERLAAQVKAQLLAVEEAQKKQLNAIYGTIDTDNMNSMQRDMPAGNVVVGGSVARGPEKPLTSTPAPDSIAAAGIPNDKNTTETRTLVAGDLIGTTYYGSLAGEMAGVQQSTQRLESEAATTIRQVAAECGGPASTPSPGP